MPDLTKDIDQQFKKIKISCSENQIQQFNMYINLLNKWNKAFNLTSVRNIMDMLERHLVDSLSIAKYIQGERLIDVGTGAGLPGIPLAILYPKKTFFLLDSNGKKTRFLKQVKTEMTLDNIEVINMRTENYQPDEKFDGVLSRAFSSLQEMIEVTEHLCKKEGYFFAMKGQYPELELQAITKPYKVQKLDWLSNELERHLIIISQSP